MDDNFPVHMFSVCLTDYNQLQIHNSLMYINEWTFGIGKHLWTGYSFSIILLGALSHKLDTNSCDYC